MSGSITLRGASDAAIAQVDNNRLRTRPLTEWERAVEDGRAFAFSNATYDYTAIDTIIGLENNSATQDLKIERIVVTGSTATEFLVHTSSGVTMAGTAIVGVNMNRNSNASADATAIGDETGNQQQEDSYTGKLITGRFANNGIVDLPIGGSIILPNDHNIGIDFTTNGTTANCTIWAYFQDT